MPPWEQHARTLIYKERSRLCGEPDIPYYPIRLVKDKSQLARYVEMAHAETKTTFVGRLGTYRYLDMHVTIAEALDTVDNFLNCRESTQPMPAFVVDPL